MSKKSEYKQKNEAFLAAKRQEEGVKELAKGVLYEVQKSGNPQGRRPDLRSVVCVHYTGRLINGRVFDDSRCEGIPAAFRLFEVIDGWQIALSQMRPGDRWTIYIPAALAYGSRTDGDIPGNSTLIFDVELLSIA